MKDILGRLTFTPDLNSAVKDADLVIEAIVENLDAKKKLFGGIDKVSEMANTSSFKSLKLYINILVYLIEFLLFCRSPSLVPYLHQTRAQYPFLKSQPRVPENRSLLGSISSIQCR